MCGKPQILCIHLHLSFVLWFPCWSVDHVTVSNQLQLLQLSLRFSGFCVKARRLGYRFEEKVYLCIKYPNILAILSYV